MKNDILPTVPGNFFTWNSDTKRGLAMESDLPPLGGVFMVESHKTGKLKSFVLVDTLTYVTKSGLEVFVSRTYETMDGITVDVICE